MALVQTDNASVISIHSPHARGDSAERAGGPTTCRFQSTPLMRGETRHKTHAEQVIAISIHSPHARGDKRSRYSILYKRYFNPLPSCEGRPIHNPSCHVHDAFQSTPLMRGETLSPPYFPPFVVFQSTPLMRGETSTASLRTLNMCHFNPLPSCEGRRNGRVEYSIIDSISIHSPHARGDRAEFRRRHVRLYFNPLPSCEGRHISRRITTE